MSINLIFDAEALGKAPPWDPADAAKLEAALEVLQRRHGLDVDWPTERGHAANCS